MAFHTQSGTSPGPHIQGSPRYGVLVATVASLGALMFGFDIAIIAGATPFIQKYFALTDLQLGWGVSCLLLGCIAGSGTAGKLADRYGRRTVLLVVALLFTVSSIATGLAPTFTVFVIARIVGGLAVGAASMISPMYVAEISPSDIRGKMVSLCQLGITVGIVISFLTNYWLRDFGSSNWRWMFMSGAAPSLAFFFLLFLVPESPRWLFASGQEPRAFQVLARLGGEQSAHHELESMRSNTQLQLAEVHHVFSRRYRRVMSVGILLAVLIQMCGMNAVISYAPIILGRSGSHIDTTLFQTFIIGSINMLATLVAVFAVDRVGRKLLYITGSLGMLFALVLIGVSFALPAAGNIFGLLSILLFVGFFAACVGPVFWILMSEMFPSAIRASAMSIAVLATWASNFAMVLLFPWVFRHIGGSATFWAIAVVPLVMWLVSWKFLPETKGKTLEEIDVFWTNSATPQLAGAPNFRRDA